MALAMEGDFCLKTACPRVHCWIDLYRESNCCLCTRVVDDHSIDIAVLTIRRWNERIPSRLLSLVGRCTRFTGAMAQMPGRRGLAAQVSEEWRPVVVSWDGTSVWFEHVLRVDKMMGNWPSDIFHSCLSFLRCSDWPTSCVEACLRFPPKFTSQKIT